jgi:hypothetical protein
MTFAFVAEDYAGMVAVITAASAFVGACAAAYIKVVKELHELKAQNVVQQAQNEVIHDAVNSNMSDAMDKIEDLHGEVATAVAEVSSLKETAADDKRIRIAEAESLRITPTKEP